MKFKTWKIDGSTCEAHFTDAAGKIARGDMPAVEKAYWDTMNTENAVKEGPLEGVTFKEAKKAKSEFPFMTL